jgi:hypothetical protein
MAISNVNSTNSPASVSSVSSTAATSQANRGKQSAEPQEAAIVTLSAQARKLSLSQPAPASAPAQSQTRSNQVQATNRADTAVTEKVVAKAKEAAESPAAQLREPETQPKRNETKTRINTYA